MKRYLVICSFALLALISCTESKKNMSQLIEIDIASNINQLVELRATDFIEKIQYIPLETTDDCLIGNNPTIQTFNDKIIITTRNDCFLFNKNTGKFIRKIGHIGDDPEGYSGTFCWINEEQGILYFNREPNWLMKYDFDGNFIGKVEKPTMPEPPSYYAFQNSTIIGYYNKLITTNPHSIVFFNENSTMLDTIPALLAPLQTSMDDIASINVTKNKNNYGNWGLSGIIQIDYKNDTRIMANPTAPVLWRTNEAIRFKEYFVDTIYTITKHYLEPYLIYNTGSWHWPAEERYNKAGDAQHIAITHTMENNRSIVFQFVKGLYRINR